MRLNLVILSVLKFTPDNLKQVFDKMGSYDWGEIVGVREEDYDLLVFAGYHARW